MGEDTGASGPVRGERDGIPPTYLPVYACDHPASLPSPPSLVSTQEREAQFEEAIAEGGERVVSSRGEAPSLTSVDLPPPPQIPGEGPSEAVMAGKKTVETVRAVSGHLPPSASRSRVGSSPSPQAERIMEALQVYVEERAKMEEYREDCRAAGKEVSCLDPDLPQSWPPV